MIKVIADSFKVKIVQRGRELHLGFIFSFWSVDGDYVW